MGPLCFTSALAIVLLGSSDPTVMRERTDLALRLREAHPEASLWITGTPAEVDAVQRRVPEVCVEPQATSTAGNAFFMKHALPPSTQEAWVVTSEWHMPRTQKIFNHVWHDTPWVRLYISVQHEDCQATHRFQTQELVHASHWRRDILELVRK